MEAALMQDREDRPAWVEFELRAIKDTAASKEKGRWIGRDVEFVLVTPPYTKDCFEFKVDSWLKNQEENVRNGRVPKTHLDYWKQSYHAWKEGLEPPLDGTDIRNWGMPSPAQIKTMQAAGIRTIEDMAQATEECLRRIGIGSLDLKHKAIATLQASKDHGPIVAENAELKARISQLEGAVTSLQTRLEKTVQAADEIEVPHDEGEDDLSLEERYAEKFGKAPHHKMKRETILRELEK